MMRHIVFFFISGLFQNSYAQQKLIIHVFERTEHIKFSNTSIDSVLSFPDLKLTPDFSNTTFVIDFSNLTSTYYVNGILSSELPVRINQIGKSLFNIQILEDGFDYGLFVDTSEPYERAFWYWNDVDQTIVKDFTKFIIEKSS